MLKFILLALSFASFATKASAQTLELSPEAQECQDFNDEIPAYFKKGTITVPEDWSHPEGQKIKVFYYGNFGDQHQTPIIFFNGGPTFHSHVAFGQIQTNAKSSDLPIVYMDQRGTGCSDPYPSDLTTATIEKLALYGSRSIVKDAEALRKLVLKNRKWKVYGQSYGGLIAHRYLEVAPEGIASLHIHGNAVMSDWQLFYKMRLLSQKRVVENYFLKYPSDRDLLKALRTQIPASTCFDNKNIKICGDSMLDAAVLILGFPSSWDNLHISLASLVDKEGVLQNNRLSRFVDAFIFQTFSNQSMPVGLIAKLEMNSGDDNNQCTEALNLLKADGETPETWPLNECRLASNIQYIASNPASDALMEGFKKKDPLLLSTLKDSLARAPQLKLFLYSGQLDVYVPKETYAEEVQLLGSRIQYTNFEDSGHDVYLIEPQVWDELRN